MGRAPCCEKMGMKRGPWSPEEDQILIYYIHLYGHSNWRPLSKHAGILRCGKSCRLRWINYPRPDIKRGNFTSQEEQTIISLHQLLGNRWSAIAAKLPGRPDNEIKDVWHTHLKKRLNNSQNEDGETKDIINLIKDNKNEDKEVPVVVVDDDQSSLQQQYSSNSITTFDISNNNKNDMISNEDLSALVDDESFWLDDIVSVEHSKFYNDDMEFGFSFSLIVIELRNFQTYLSFEFDFVFLFIFKIERVDCNLNE